MSRLALAAIASVVLAGCASRSAEHQVTPASVASATVSDARGDALNADGNPRHARPDVDVARVGIDRNSDRTFFTITTVDPPHGPLRYEIFGQSDDVSGYDVVSISRRGDSVTGYVAFENSVARQRLTAPQSISVNGATLGVSVPIDPIFGATRFEWRLTVRTASGAEIFDRVPSGRQLSTFPRG
jgi:hypothetical protein